eukprot:52633-Amphidinium_carterae.1
MLPRRFGRNASQKKSTPVGAASGVPKCCKSFSCTQEACLLREKIELTDSEKVTVLQKTRPWATTTTSYSVPLQQSWQS